MLPEFGQLVIFAVKIYHGRLAFLKQAWILNKEDFVGRENFKGYENKSIFKGIIC